MTLLVEQAALMMTVQDLGRNGYQRFGLPESGPMDRWAQRAANRLVGNGQQEACVEVGYSTAAFRLESDMALAVTGAGYELFVNGRRLPLWMAFHGRAGDFVTLEKADGGSWAYLAAAGGLLTRSWMGSRSTYARGGLGARLAAGERLPVGLPGQEPSILAGRSFSLDGRPDYRMEEVTLRVVIGPHQHRFTDEALETFTAQPFALSPKSDRMGYRLTGPALAHTRGADLVSQGMALGEVQVPGDGQPIVMMPDHPTTGGYTCLGTVIRADLPLLAQAQPGTSRIRFEPVSVAEAQALYRRMLAKIDEGVQDEEAEWLYL